MWPAEVHKLTTDLYSFIETNFEMLLGEFLSDGDDIISAIFAEAARYREESHLQVSA